MVDERRSVMLLDGDHAHSPHVAAELSADLGVKIIGVGTGANSPLLRSRHCHALATAPAPQAPGYGRALVALVEHWRPDLVLPVGYRSVEALCANRAALPAGARVCLPSAAALHAALHKRATLALARSLGVATPEDYTDRVEAWRAAGETAKVAVLPFPLFLKAEKEAGRNILARVEAAEGFWERYESLRCEAQGPILVQECIEGDPSTYGCGCLFLDGRLVLSFAQQELRSVPRVGGSGTRLRLYHDPMLEALSVSLLSALNWNGLALVEFKRRRDGTYVLMEINPKFWASYALASRYGYRFASHMAAGALGLAAPPAPPAGQVGEMAFPLRELLFWAKHGRKEPLGPALAAMLWPPCRWDLDWRDPGAWTAPYRPGPLWARLRVRRRFVN